MNQQQFDEDLKNPDAWMDGEGWTNNPIRDLFDNPRQSSTRNMGAADEALETTIDTNHK